MKKIVILLFALCITFYFNIDTKANFQEHPSSSVKVVVTDLEGNLIESHTEKFNQSSQFSIYATTTSTLSYTSINIVFGSDIKSTVKVTDYYIGGVYYRDVNYRDFTIDIVSGNMSNSVARRASGLSTGITTDSESKQPVKLTIQATINDSRIVYHHYTIYTDKYNVNPIS